jgi:hypothetical protein
MLQFLLLPFRRLNREVNGIPHDFHNNTLWDIWLVKEMIIVLFNYNCNYLVTKITM